MQVFCDFDGTISIQDATDFILARFADLEWEDIEEQWKKGAVGSAQCMQRQIALIRATKRQLDAALDEIEIDPSFPAFASYCCSQGIALTILSDGVDYFIHRILARHRLPLLPVIANQLTICGQNGNTRYHLAFPFSQATCDSAAGMCKCRCVGSPPPTRLYIGDGRSDFCVANKPDLVFGKNKLAKYCERQGIAFIRYRRFADVTRALKTRVPTPLRRPSETPTRALA
ncbi:MAG: MtnX-like HAD-IB family phosphatase [Candidatus Binatia bacterium]